MKVFKFGGASVKNSQLLDNVYQIVKSEENLIIVVSAIDKTTNHLERLVNSYFKNENSKLEEFEKIKKFHFSYINDAFNRNDNEIIKIANNLFDELYDKINCQATDDYDFEYDAIVSFGELLSTSIFSEYLKYKGIKNRFVDIRKSMVTDSNFRDAKIIWERSNINVKQAFSDKNYSIYVTQGFIGSDKSHHTTTLGREGSDYTASAIAHIIDAESVTIWKDVPGIMNADPAWCNFAEKLDILSFQEAIELAFYGAKVIHPKTIKPIENKNIPLFVKSFIHPEEEGTKITKLNYALKLIPIYILKQNQILISIFPKDFSFIVEENMSKIFGLFAKYKVKVNITQNSAISFSASIDSNNRNFNNLIEELQKEYFVKYNENLELITIRYYNDEAIAKMTEGRQILVEQKSRNTARFVIE